MPRPRIFLSAVSQELAGARRSAGQTLRTLGYDPVSQDDFPTGHGELKAWLKEQLQSCEGVIQLLGLAYGQEPPQPDPEFGRVSYTQFELLYAEKIGKKIWIVEVGEDGLRDTPPDKCDLPEDDTHPDSLSYQAERRGLQAQYREQLQQANFLRHLAKDNKELELLIRRLRDELELMRKKFEQNQRRQGHWLALVLTAVLSLGGGGYWAYTHLCSHVDEVGKIDAARIQAHLQHTVEQTYRRELAESERIQDWKERQQRREAVELAQAARLGTISQLGILIAEIEGRGQATSVFQEMTRILNDQGVDEALAYVESQKSDILKEARARQQAVREKNRQELQPLLTAAGLHQTKGEVAQARSLYAQILEIEPNWPAALHEAMWFAIAQGDQARVHGTLQEVGTLCQQAHDLAQRLLKIAPENSEWQRDLSVSLNKLGDLSVKRGDLAAAQGYYAECLSISRKLVSSDKSTSGWQRDLSVSLERLGDLSVKRGDLAAAQGYYAEDLSIARKLASSDESNSG